MRVSVNKALAHSSFWLATLVMAVMGWTLYVAGVREAESAKQVSHTQDVRAQVSKVSDLARRAEEAQRGYLLSGGLGFLGQREQAFKGMSEALGEVRELTVESRSQQLRVSQLEALSSDSSSSCRATSDSSCRPGRAGKPRTCCG